MVEHKDIALDPEAQRLFAQFGGLEAYRAQTPVVGTAQMTQRLLEEQKRHDSVRKLMVQATWLISRYLADDALALEPRRDLRLVEQLAAVLARLGQTAGHLGCLLVRFRGSPSEPELPARLDYELVAGHTLVDSRVLPAVARRNGDGWAKLSDQLQDACMVLADYGVNNIFVRLPADGDMPAEALRVCLKILAGFRRHRQDGTPILMRTDNEQRMVPLVNDENLFPDPNLTVLAGLNRLSAATMTNLVDKVDRWLRRQAAQSALKRYAGVYSAALELPKVSAKVRKPPLELNNVKWLLTETDDQAVSAEKLDIARLAVNLAAASPQQVARMIQSVYGDDYGRIDSRLLGERLHLSSNMLQAADRRSAARDLGKAVLGNLQLRLDQVKDSVIDDIHVVEARDRTPAETPAPDPAAVHKDIFRMVSFYKGRSTTRKKMVGMVHQPIQFSAHDYAILAKDFQIDRGAAETLVRALKGCFDAQGRFLKRAFAEAVPLFRRYEQKIFHFLWHHMKDVVLPADRTAFLNALQMLTSRMDQPKKALKILIEDLCCGPDDIQFSDNKAIMLANLILHRDKSITDYDMTPEDIVLSRHGIDKQVVQYAAWRVAKDQEAFAAKMRAIHRQLVEALHLGQTAERRLPPAFLLNLERELFIFFSLVACDAGKATLRSAALEYGDPTASIYHQNHSGNCMGGLLQNLRVALRGVGCVGAMPDVTMLEGIKAHEETFMRLKKDPQYRAQARMITEWVDEAIKLIRFRS